MSCKITVVTPSYNQARYLDETLRSVLSQRQSIHEYLVLDGGSNDGSAEMIRKYAEAGCGIDYWHSRKDKGQSDAIHQGFARASGDVLGWLNSDDVLLPGALAAVGAAFDAHPEWDVVTGWHVRIDAESRLLSFHRIPGESVGAARRGVFHVCQPGCFFRRSVYERVGGLDPGLHCMMDTDLWLRMFDAGARWGHVPRYLAAFRVHATSKGTSWTAEYDAEVRRITATHPRYFARPVHNRLGLAGYRVGQLVSGRQLAAWRDGLRGRGAALADVFPGTGRLDGGGSGNGDHVAAEATPAG